MQPVPRIFVSATSRDLRTARGLVSEGLRRMECLPIVQDDFPPDYKSVRDMLRTKIATCDAVVHLAGFYYGAEPQPVLPGPDRRSFTQMEYEIAMELKKPCYVFLCGENFPFDKHDPEPEDKQQLQRDHRARLLQRDELFYEFATPEELSSRTRELQLSVENLREELAKERGRRRLTLIVAVAAVIIAIGGGIFLMGRQGEQAKVIAATNLKLEQQGALIEQLLAEQARLRKGGATDMRQIAMQAEQNVAHANNQSVEEVRRTVENAIAEAQQAVAEARAGKGGLASALRRAAEKSAKGKVATGSNRDLAAALQRLAEAQLAAGHVNEAIEAQVERLALLDRDKDPEVWAESARTLAMAMRDRDVMSVEPKKILTEAVTWAKGAPALGPENPSTLALLTSLAEVTVEPDEKVALNRAVLKAWESQSGTEDSQKMKATLALARALGYAGKETRDETLTAESLDLFQKVLDANEKKFGPSAPETLETMSDLAAALLWQKKIAEAEALYQKILTAREKSLGPDDEKTVSIVQMMAFVKEDQKDYPGAISLARRALASAERRDGPDAPKTLAATTLLAGLLERSKTPANLDEAETLTRKVLETRIRTIGAAQPDTLQSFENLARLLKAKGDKAGATKVTLRLLDEQGKAVGADDTGYAFQLFIVASNLFVDDDNQNARGLAERCLKIREAKLGADNPDTLATMELLTSIYNALDETEKAETLARRTLMVREKGSSSSPQELAKANSRIAGILIADGRSAEAMAFARKAAEITSSLPEGDDTRDNAEKQLASLEKKIPPAEAFAGFRKEWKDKSDKGDWKEVRINLAGNSPAHSHYVLAWFDGPALMRLMQVDSSGETDGTYTFYYWTETGSLASVVEIREGTATKKSGVAKISDTYNFAGGNLAGWIRIEDGDESEVDPAEPDFAAVGKRVAAEAAAVFRKTKE